jgi:cytochrome c-type biogenesis protein CcmH/NrfF
MIVPFLLVAPPWELWFQWLYWFIPTALVVTSCVLMTTAAGKAERAKWVRKE